MNELIFKPTTEKEESEVLGQFGDLTRTIALGIGVGEPKNCFLSCGIALEAARLVEQGCDEPRVFRKRLRALSEDLDLKDLRSLNFLEPKWRQQIRSLERVAEVGLIERMGRQDLALEMSSTPRDLILGIKGYVDGEPTLHAVAVLGRCEDNYHEVLVWEPRNPCGLCRASIGDLAVLGDEALKITAAPNLIRISPRK